MGVKAGNQTLAGLKGKLASLPRTLAADVARRTSPVLTDLTRDAFTGGRSVYGEARPLSTSGKPLTLQRTGAVAGQLRFVTIGTITRVVLGPSYSKYLIKYGLLPNGPLPVSYRDAITQVVRETRAP